MQIQYQLDIDDLVAFSLHHSRVSKNLKRRLLLTQAWGVFCSLMIALIWPGWSTTVKVIFFGVSSAFWVIAYPRYYRWVIKRNTRRNYSEGHNRGIVGEHVIVIDPEGVKEVSEVGESTTVWSGIERVEENDNYLFLYTGPIQAHVIPKRGFADDQQITEFSQLARSYLSGSR